MASPVSRDPLSVPSPPHTAAGQKEAGTWVVSLAASSVVGDILASWLVLAQLLALAEGLDPGIVGQVVVSRAGAVVPTMAEGGAGQGGQ